jgi:glyoxylase-like metal-dependent hydrolase (beta-lactamase superfamily II)
VLPFPTDNTDVNVYLFTEPEPVLIDAGFQHPDGWAQLQQALAAHGLTVRDLARVIITHPHVDHYGLAAQIADAGPAEIWMSAVGVQWLHQFPTLWAQRIAYYREHFLPGADLPPALATRSLSWMERTLAAWQPIPVARIRAFPLDQPLPLGGLDWQVLHLTGHDNQLTCFYQPQTQQLLSADMLMIPTATPVLEAPPPGATRQPALPRMVQSLTQLAALEVATVYPGHGAPFADHRRVIESQIARIQARTAECWQYLQAGTSTVAELFARLYGPRMAAVGLAGVWMVVGYLDLLQAAGRVTAQVEQGVWRYRIIPEQG